MDNLGLAARRFLASLGTGGRGVSMSSVVSGLGELFKNLDTSTQYRKITADRTPYRPRHDTWMWVFGAALPRVSMTTVAELLGVPNIRRFASLLHIEYGAALHGLTIALPTMVENSTSVQSAHRITAAANDPQEFVPSVPVSQIANALAHSVRSFSQTMEHSRNGRKPDQPA